IGLGSTSISAALLHDVVEDTDYTIEDLEMIFGERVARIVDGLTKISSGMFGSNVSAQSENFRKLLLTMSNDIRVILIKIADRLHNKRTLSSMAPAKQYKITGETNYIYAPLAHRLGLFAIKTELEELCFKYEHPVIFEDITAKIKQTADERNKIFDNFAKPVWVELDKMDIDYEMRARVKSVYSIWNKMEIKKVDLHEIYDIFAVRIIFEIYPGMDEKKQCWDIYSAITDIYKLRPDRIRDWVSRPKSNGYQALHLTVMGPDGKWIEIQIRSRRMDDIAEKGFAAHWKYKAHNVEEDNELDKWLRTIQEILANPNPNAVDFLDTIKLNLFAMEIFVFTPKGDIKTLPHGATALDFAYMLHTDIGDNCLGAKVNHKLVPLSQKLSSGDQVEVLTSASQKPEREWIHYVTTAKAKSSIETALRREWRAIAKEGKLMLDKLFVDESVDRSVLDRILYYYDIDKKEELFYQIGNNEIELPENSSDFYKKKKGAQSDNLLLRYMKQAYNAMRKPSDEGSKVKTKSIKSSEYDEEEASLELEEIDRKAKYKLIETDQEKNFIVPTCCRSLPGDDVFGYINEDEKVEVHKSSCQNGLKLKSNFGDRVIEVVWGDYKQYTFKSSVFFTGIDKKGILNRIIASISEEISVNILGMEISTKDGIFEGEIEVSLHSVKDVQDICSAIAKVDGVNTVHRSAV
ncbi:MAG: bifunctional (p)ppGpp synthetase/guanosine-3',5'-bis(diphosphate) 3'-pyrophosphohydrolase, partial [Bacteroidales bacterium]|nr:bifunctional (p)ppGpp synthetase/guanosine-3',5'-bis(diphosphate) 3'-pyrophosphohydrolase [Bacteroidales bacterium]